MRKRTYMNWSRGIREWKSLSLLLTTEDRQYEGIHSRHQVRWNIHIRSHGRTSIDHKLLPLKPVFNQDISIENRVQETTTRYRSIFVFCFSGVIIVKYTKMQKRKCPKIFVNVCIQAENMKNWWVELLGPNIE